MARTFLLIWLAAALALAAPVAADDRAAWGYVVHVGTEDSTLLLEAGRSFHLIAVDPTGVIRGPKGGSMTLTDVRAGDRIDYAWSPWAGVAVADVLHVTPRRQVGERRPEAPRPATWSGDQPTAGGVTFLK